MDHLLHPEIQKEYVRWLSKLGDNDHYSGPVTVGIHDVLRAHFLIADHFVVDEGEGLGGIGPKSLDLFQSAVARQVASYAGQDKWKDKYHICATLFYGLIMNHPFHDANKRTAFLVTLHHLQKLGRIPKVSGKEFERLALRLAEHSLSEYPAYRDLIRKKKDDSEVLFIAEFFRHNTRDIDKQLYLITYSQFDRLLRRFGYYLANPYKNYIDVVKDVEEKTGLLSRTTRKVQKKVDHIGFPGWKSQVDKGVIKAVREKTGLTATNGIDSQVFYRDIDPIESLIPAYHSSLKRLAKK